MAQPLIGEAVDRIPSGLSTEQPGGQGGILLAVGPGPDQNQLGLGSGHRHIGQPLGLGRGLPLRLLRRLPALPPVDIHPHQALSGAGVTPERTGHGGGGLPEVGADHHRIFQTLAAVDGDHGDGAVGLIAVGLASLRHRLAGVQPLPPQPIRRGGHIKPLAVHRLLHQPCRLLQIPQHPAPFRQARHLFTLEQIGQRPEQAQPRHRLSQTAQLQRQLIQQGRLQGIGRDGHQSRAGQQTQASVIARFRQGIEEPLQQQGSFTVEHIALGHQASGESADPKGASQVFRLLMTTHQHAEICGGEVLPLLQLLQHHRGEPLGQLCFQGTAAGGRLGGEQQQLQRRGILRWGGGAAGLHRGHRQFRSGEPRSHQAVQPLHQRCRCAEVVEQVIDPLHLIPRCHVGGQITTPEAVDRLLGIPHHQQQVAFTTTEGALQQTPLHGVGVLKLIHHHRPVALLQRGKPGNVAIARVHGGQQAAKGDHPAAATAAVQLLQAPFQQVLPGALNRCIPERRNSGLQSRRHQAGVGLTALARDLAPTAGMEVLLQRLLMGGNLQQ